MRLIYSVYIPACGGQVRRQTLCYMVLVCACLSAKRAVPRGIFKTSEVVDFVASQCRRGGHVLCLGFGSRRFGILTAPLLSLFPELSPGEGDHGGERVTSTNTY